MDTSIIESYFPADAGWHWLIRSNDDDRGAYFIHIYKGDFDPLTRRYEISHMCWGANLKDMWQAILLEATPVKLKETH